MKKLTLLFGVAMLAAGFYTGWYYAPRIIAIDTADHRLLLPSSISDRGAYRWVKVGTQNCLYRIDGTRAGCWVPTKELGYQQGQH